MKFFKNMFGSKQKKMSKNEPNTLAEANESPDLRLATSKEKEVDIPVIKKEEVKKIPRKSATATATKAQTDVEKADNVEAEKKPATNKTTTVAIESESDPVPECERIGQIDFYYSDHVLFSLSADANYRLTSLVIPSELGGEQITELVVDFWRFCDSNPNLKQVTIPDTVTSFGDVSYLNEKMEIICKQGSAADIFFSAKGYTVKYS